MRRKAMRKQCCPRSSPPSLLRSPLSRSSPLASPSSAHSVSKVSSSLDLTHQTPSRIKTHLHQISKKQYFFHLFCYPKSEEILLQTSLPLGKVVPRAMPKTNVRGESGMVQLRVSQPIVRDSFTVLSKRLKSQSCRFKTYHTCRLDQNTSSIEPNLVVFPFTQFRVTLDCIGLSQPLHLEFLVELPAGCPQGVLSVSHLSARLQLQFLRDPQSINSELTKMNFKYPFNSRKQVVILRKLIIAEQETETQSDSLLKDSNSSDKIATNSNKSRSNNSKSFSKSSFDQILGDDNLSELTPSQLVQVSRSSGGSRGVQEFLKSLNEEQFEMYFETIAKRSPEIVVDSYANYMLQVFFQICSSEQKLVVIRYIIPKLTFIICDKRGTHAMQTIVSTTQTPEEWTLIVSALSRQPQFLEVCTNTNSCHFMQKCLQHFSCESMQEWLRLVLQGFNTLVFNSHGMCVLKAFQHKFRFNNSFLDQLVFHYTKNLSNLIVHPYANYALQQIIEIRGIKGCHSVSQRILDGLCQYSNLKEGSIVIEKCISMSKQWAAQARLRLIEQNSFKSLKSTKHGSYILQRLKVEAKRRKG